VAWFLYSTIENFLPYCDVTFSEERIRNYKQHLLDLKTAVEEQAWDGDWYRRAYFDDGTPLGSAKNEECRIDSIAQSWAVLSGAANPVRAARAMEAVDGYLIHRGDGLVKLFTPPFDNGSTDPGYIKGYLPGVRENGGQYTHAALWTLMAFAKLGDGDRAGELYSLLNPVNHASTRAGLHKYKVEPYVAAADIYGLSPHVGRGGWTWYTGSASWMYRAALESILGIELRTNVLRIKPCLPKHWPSFEFTYRRGQSRYNIKIKNGKSASDFKGFEVSLVDDGKEHNFDFEIK
jgi:cyclic beta-1,2-glucan synthetase